MARNENLLKQALDLVKPEFKAELEKIMKELAAKWDSLSEDEHEDYYWGDGTIGFVFDDNEDLWKALPENLNEITIGPNDEDGLSDYILDYVCPLEDDINDDDPFDTHWDEADTDGLTDADYAAAISRITVENLKNAVEAGLTVAEYVGTFLN